jgi:hypothetical protein
VKKANGCKRLLTLVEKNSFPEDIRVFHEATTLTDAGYTVSVICLSKANRPWHEALGGIHFFRYLLLVAGSSVLTYISEFSYSLLAMFFVPISILWKRTSISFT